MPTRARGEVRIFLPGRHVPLSLGTNSRASAGTVWPGVEVSCGDEPVVAVLLNDGPKSPSNASGLTVTGGWASNAMKLENRSHPCGAQICQLADAMEAWPSPYGRPDSEANRFEL